MGLFIRLFYSSIPDHGRRRPPHFHARLHGRVQASEGVRLGQGLAALQGVGRAVWKWKMKQMLLKRVIDLKFKLLWLRSLNCFVKFCLMFI